MLLISKLCLLQLSPLFSALPSIIWMEKMILSKVVYWLTEWTCMCIHWQEAIISYIFCYYTLAFYIENNRDDISLIHIPAITSSATWLVYIALSLLTLVCAARSLNVTIEQSYNGSLDCAFISVWITIVKILLHDGRPVCLSSHSLIRIISLNVL